MTTATVRMTSTSRTGYGVRASLMQGVVDSIRAGAAWSQRHSQRRALSALTPEQLTDIGVSAGDAAAEARKPFWRA